MKKVSIINLEYYLWGRLVGGPDYDSIPDQLTMAIQFD